MKPDSFKLDGKPSPILDRYSKLREKHNPNRYYYLGHTYLILTPQPISTENEHVFILRLDEHIDDAFMTINKRRYQFKQLNESTWLGKVSFQTLPDSEDLPILIELKNKDITFYKCFDVDLSKRANWKPFLNERFVALSEFQVYPKHFSRTVSKNYVPVPKNYAQHNVLDTKIMGVTSNLNVRGVKTITYRSKKVNGYKEGTYEGTQRDELLLININGQAGPVEVEATIQDSTVDVDGINNNSVRLSTDTWELYFGEYIAQLNKTELTAFSKRLDGVKGVYRSGPWQIEALTSETKGDSNYEQIRGNNSQGPYYLAHSPIVIYTEKVKLNGLVLQREVDYDLDYDLGKITLKRHFLLSTELLEIDYEYADTVFKKTLTAFDIDYAPSANANSYGISFLNQKDQVSSEEISELSDDPISHTVLGLRMKRQNDTWTTYQELAMSDKHEIWTDRHDTDFAIKENIAYRTDKTRVELGVKKIGDRYDALGNPSLYPSLLEYDYVLNTKPSELLEISSGHDVRAYVQNTQPVREEVFDFGLDYRNYSFDYFSRFDSNLSYVDNPFSLKQDRYSTSFTTQKGFLRLKPGYQVEQLNYTFEPSSNEKNTAIRFDTSVIDIPFVSFTTHSEWKHRDLYDGTTQYRYSHGFVSEIEPIRRYSFQGSGQYVDDSEAGKRALANLAYRFRVSRLFQTNGSYELETVNESFSEDSFRVMKHRANLRFRLRPSRKLSLSYRLKPQFNEVLSNKVRYEEKLTHQLQLDSSLTPKNNLSIAYKLSEKNTLKTTSIPEVEPNRFQKRSTYLGNYTYRINEKSTARYALEYDLDTTFDYSQVDDEQLDYETIKLSYVTHQLGYSNQIKSNLRLDSDYKHQESKAIQELSTEGNSHLITDSVELSSEWQLTQKLNARFTTNSSLQREKIQDYEDTFLLGPRVDLVYRLFNNFNVSGFLEMNRSVSGETQERYKASLRTRYDAKIKQVLQCNVIAQIDYETEREPLFYEIWDFILQFSLNF